MPCTTNDSTHPQVPPAWEASAGQRMGPGEVGRAAGIWGTGCMAMTRAGEKKGTGLHWSKGQPGKDPGRSHPGTRHKGRKGISPAQA